MSRRPARTSGRARRAPVSAPDPAPAVLLPRSAAYRIFWLGRYLERADANVRLLDASYYALLETETDAAAVRAEWLSVLQSLGVLDDYVRRHGEVEPKKAAAFILLDEANPSSVLRCLRMAREDGNGTLPDGIYIRLNRLYLRVSAARIDEVLADGLHEFLAEILAEIDLINGMIDREWA